MFLVPMYWRQFGPTILAWYWPQGWEPENEILDQIYNSPLTGIGPISIGTFLKF